jgi:hypothetical protein
VVVSYLPPTYGHVYALEGRAGGKITVTMHSPVKLSGIGLVHVFRDAAAMAEQLEAHAERVSTDAYTYDSSEPANSEKNMQSSALRQFALTGDGLVVIW